jgi:carbonic anhydrase
MWVSVCGAILRVFRRTPNAAGLLSPGGVRVAAACLVCLAMQVLNNVIAWRHARIQATTRYDASRACSGAARSRVDRERTGHVGSSHDLDPSSRRRFVAGVASLPLAWGAARWFAHGAAAAEFDYDATPVAPATDGMQRLIDGNKRYVAGELTAFDELAADREESATGQSPFAVIVSCADSRVPPELIFDQTVGELFVVRSAGQVVDEAIRGSITYGVDVLKAPLIVVLGHSNCGAVGAAIAALDGNPIPGYAYRFAEAIGPAVQEVRDEPGDLLDNAIRANVTLGVERLSTAEPDLAAVIGDGSVTIVGAYYDLASGEVTFL